MAGGGGREEAPWGSPPPHTLPPPPVPPSPTVPARAPAGRSPGSEDVSGHPRPANSKKCERWGVGGGGGKAEAGSLPSLWKSKELPSSQRPCWYPDHPPPSSSIRRELRVPCKFASLFIPLSCQVSYLPEASKARVSLFRSPPLSPTPHPHPQLCLPTSHYLLCCFAWLCS